MGAFAVGEKPVLRERRPAREEIGEEGGDDEADEEAEEDVVDDHPSLGGQTREAFVEEDDGDFNHADGEVEDHLVDAGEL